MNMHLSQIILFVKLKLTHIFRGDTMESNYLGSVLCYTCQHLDYGSDKCWVNKKYHPYTSLKNHQCENYVRRGKSSYYGSYSSRNDSYSPRITSWKKSHYKY